MNEEQNFPVSMQSNNPELGYFFYNPEEVEGEQEVDLASSTQLTTEFAEGILQFLGGATQQSSLPQIVNSEELNSENQTGEEGHEMSHLMATAGDAFQPLESGEEMDDPIIIYPSHETVYIPAKYFESDEEAGIKMHHFTASAQGEKFKNWVLEKDSEAFASDFIEPDTIEVNEEIQEVFEASLDPMAQGTVMAYCHVTKSIAQPLWPTGRGEGVTVAVLDTGLDLTNALLTRGSRGGVSFVPGRRSYHDDNGHGTHVTGIIASRPGIHKNGLKLYWSIAPGARHYTIKVLNSRGSGGWSAIARGIDRARIIGADVINMSLGSSRKPPVIVERAIRRAAWRQVIIASAGNRGPRNNTVGWPARYRQVIGVGAIDCKRKIAKFSSRGPADPRAFVEDHVECVAPGKDIYSNKLRGGASSLKKMSGTSMSAPVVSGICALLKQKDRKLVGTSRFRYRLRQSYIDLGIYGPDNWYGLGMAFFHPRS